MDAEADLFLDRCLTAIRERQEKDAHLAATERGIAAERAVLRQEIDRFIQSANTYASVMGVAVVTPAVAEDTGDTEYGDLSNLSVAEACERVMRIHGGAARVTMLMDALRNGGKLRNGNRNAQYATVITAMGNHPDRFKKLSPGEWVLTSAGNGGARHRYD